MLFFSDKLVPPSANRRTAGLTLVELLVVIAVLSIATALLIPQLRIVNEDRNIRETARVVSSVFSSARDRAVANQTASGVLIERNVNFTSSTPSGSVLYAGTRMVELQTTSFTGDDDEAFLLVYEQTPAGAPTQIWCLIPQPFEHDPANNQFVVCVGDFVAFDGSRFEIVDVGAPLAVNFTGPGTICGDLTGPTTIEMLPFRIAFNNNASGSNTDQPDFTTGQLLPVSPSPGGPNTFVAGDETAGSCSTDFSIQQYRRVNSSVVDLPAGYIIDLRYSGPLDTNDLDSEPETDSFFGLIVPGGSATASAENSEVRVLFDAQGAVERITASGRSALPPQSVNFFINEFDPNEIVADSQAQAELILNKPGTLWVTVGLQGGTNVASNVPPGGGAVDLMISNSRAFTRLQAAAPQ